MNHNEKVFEETVESLLPEVEKIGDYTLHTDARELEGAMRPLEQRLRIQQGLIPLLKGIFILLSVIVATLISVAERQEISTVCITVLILSAVKPLIPMYQPLNRDN